MHSWKRTLLLASGVVLLGGPAWAKRHRDWERLKPVPPDKPIPVSDFFRTPQLERPKFNPSGTDIAAFVTLKGDKRGVLVCEVATGKTVRFGGVANKDIYHFDWLDDRRLIFSVSADKIYAEGIFVADLNNIRDGYPVELYNSTVTVGIPRKHRLEPIVWIRHNAYDNGADGGVLQLNTRRRLNSSRGMMPGTPGTSRSDDMRYGTKAAVVRSYPRLPSGVPVNFLADRDGELAYGESVNGGVYSLFRFNGNEWTKCPVDLDAVDVVAAGDKPGELLVEGPGQPKKPRPLQLLTADDGRLGQVLWQDNRYDCESVTVVRHPGDGHLLGFIFPEEALKTVWFEPTFRRVEQMVRRQFPGEVVILLGSDPGERRFFVCAYSDRKPENYYLVDLDKRTIAPIMNSCPWIDPGRMRPTQVITYRTRDGFTIEGLLTLPAGTSRNARAPLVVLPHGGPWVRDLWGWNPEVQFLASRGYAVFQPNYRGSSGTAWQFPAGDSWDFRKMNDDVTDGVRAVLNSGLIDPNRVAIMGSSFGGYLALCGVAFDPDLYRCAVSIAGVFDWELMIREARREDDNSGRSGTLQRHLGDPAKNREKFDAISPLRHVDRIKVPVFVSHGKEDNVVYVGQSKRLIAELERHHVPHTAFLAWGEAHGMARLAHQVELYTAIESFLRKNLAPRPAVPPAT